MMSSLVDRASRLDSWKEIAAYLNRGARTVQRWEREEAEKLARKVQKGEFDFEDMA